MNAAHVLLGFLTLLQNIPNRENSHSFLGFACLSVAILYSVFPNGIALCYQV